VKGAGEKAFCAGGDIRSLHDLGKAGRHEEALTFWREEYVLNVRIKNWPKPYVSLIDGIVMGGGVGVSLHGSHRVAGDRYLFAMPEVGIGFFPDVGGSYALPRLPGATGVWLALTGDRIRRADAVALGLATHAVTSADMAALEEALIRGDDVDAALAARAAPVEEAPLAAHRDVVDRCFSAPSVIEIMQRLEREAASSPFAAAALATMRTKSPTSVRLAFEQMVRGRDASFAEAMRMEYRIVSRILEGEDFYEGVRAVVIDKDQKPVWRPARIEDVSDAEIARHFAPLAAELPVR
jgi:enoyl-CoA hydratase